MKQAFTQTTRFLMAAALMASLVVSSSDADMMPKTGAKARIDAHAKFIGSAMVSFEHEPFDLSEFSSNSPDEVIEKEAIVRVAGAPGESVVVACNVHNGKTRDCDGGEVSHLHLLRAGENMRNYVALTQDLLPIRKFNSHITIEVSYI